MKEWDGKRMWEKDAGKGAAPATNFHRRHCRPGRGCADAGKEKSWKKGENPWSEKQRNGEKRGEENAHGLSEERRFGSRHAQLLREASCSSDFLFLTLSLFLFSPCTYRPVRSGNHPYGKLNDPLLPLRFWNKETYMQRESAKIIFHWAPSRNFNPLILDGMIIRGNILRKSGTWLNGILLGGGSSFVEFVKIVGIPTISCLSDVLFLSQINLPFFLFFFQRGGWSC